MGDRLRRLFGATFCAVLLVLTWAGTAGAQAPAASTVAEQVERLSSLNPDERSAAVRALGDARAEQAVGPLARVLRSDPDADVRGWAARALGNIGTPEARAALAGAAQNDADPRVRSLAASLSGGTVATPFAGAAAPVQPQPVVHQAPVVQDRLQIRMARRERRRGVGLIAAGWATFGSTYLISLLGESIAGAAGADDAWPLYIPCAGPIIQTVFLFTRLDLEELAMLTIIDGIAQIGGLAMAIAGHVLRSRARNAQGTGGGGLPLAVVPTGPNGPGLTVSGLF